MKKIILGSILAIASSTSVYAGPNNGCGLGNQVISNQDSVIKQSLGATTNTSSFTQVFGITSGTVGCTKAAKFVSNEKAKSFIANNMDQLAVDISAGKGESIDTLASLLAVENKANFKVNLQNNFSTIFSGDDVKAAKVIDSIATVAG